MNRYLKQEIKKAFEVPVPNQKKKTQFLREFPRPPISMRQFILIQITYLRKGTVVLSGLFLLPVLIGADSINLNILWVISALIPFLGLLAVTESTRFVIYGMYELEMSARFSIKSVMLARMSVLGLLDAFILCCLIPLCYRNSSTSLLQTGVYLLVPYLLTVNISLYLTRCFHGREVLYRCMCAAVLISGGSWGLHIAADFVYQISYVYWWIILFLFLIGRMAQEIYRIMKQTEELGWNL